MSEADREAAAMRQLRERIQELEASCEAFKRTLADPEKLMEIIEGLCSAGDLHEGPNKDLRRLIQEKQPVVYVKAGRHWVAAHRGGAILFLLQPKTLVKAEYNEAPNMLFIEVEDG